MKHGGVSVFAGVGERTREGNDLWLEIPGERRHQPGRLSRSRAPRSIYGQMTEPPGARLRVGLTRPDGGRVLPRRRRQGRAALHRQHLPLHAGGFGSVGAARPHAVRGRLPADARDRDGRAAGAHHLDARRARSPRCRRSTCRPTTTPTRRRRRRSRTSTRPPTCRARSSSWAFIRRSIRWRRRRASSTRASSATSTTTSRAPVKQILQRYKDLQDIIAILGIDELSEEDKLTVAPRPQDPAVPVAAVLRRRAVHRPRRASTCRSPTRSAASRKSSTASTTTSPSRRSTWSATIEEVVEKADEDAQGLGQ